MGDEYFTAKYIVYDEDHGLAVTSYTGDYLNVGKILPEDKQYGQMPLILTLFVPINS